MTADRRTDERGSTIVIVALLLPILILMTAFAVDLGVERSARRDAQADADVVALDLVRLADGRDTLEILSSAEYATTLASAAAANDIAVADLQVQYGSFDDSVDPPFTPSTDQCPADPTRYCDVPTAVRVIASDTVDYAFARIIGADGSDVERSAVAAVDSLASLTLGSNTLSLTDPAGSTTLEFLFDTLYGRDPNDPSDDFDFNADFAGYGGLANADVSIEDLVDASSEAATPEELMEQDVSAQELGQLYAQALRNNGRTAEADILDAMAAEADGSAQFDFGNTISVDVGGPPSVADATVNAFNQFVTGLQIANSINFAASCTDVPGANLPAAATSIRACTTVIESGRTAIGRVGSAQTQPPEFRTAQVRIGTTNNTTVGESLAVGPVPAATLAGNLSLPLVLAGGGAEGTLTEIICEQATGGHTTDTLVGPRPLTATVANGQIAVLTLTSLLGVPLADITVSINNDVELVPTSSNSLVDDQLVGTTEEVPGAGLSFSTSLQPSDVTLAVNVLSTVNATTITNAVKPIIVGIVNGLINGLASPGVTALLDSLGIGVSESDLRLNWADCGNPILRG